MTRIRIRHAVAAAAAGTCIILTSQPAGAAEINPVVGKWQLRTDGGGGNDTLNGGDSDRTAGVNPVVNRAEDINPVVGK